MSRGKIAAQLLAGARRIVTVVSAAFGAVDAYEVPVRQCGWSFDGVERWLTASLKRLLLPWVSPAPRSSDCPVMAESASPGYPVANLDTWEVWVPTRNVVLTEHQEKLLAGLIASGRYQNASEVLREGLRLLEQREAERVARLQALRDAAATGLAALDRGAFVEFDGADDLVAHLNDLAERAIRSVAN